MGYNKQKKRGPLGYDIYNIDNIKSPRTLVHAWQTLFSSKQMYPEAVQI